jgi:hypothetical protein
VIADFGHGVGCGWLMGRMGPMGPIRFLCFICPVGSGWWSGDNREFVGFLWPLRRAVRRGSCGIFWKGWGELGPGNLRADVSCPRWRIVPPGDILAAALALRQRVGGSCEIPEALGG